jgi:hypothetical protein
MAQKPTSRQARERTVKLAHVEGRNYLAALADSTSVSVRADPIGTVMSLNFFRTETKSSSETFRVSEEGNVVTVIGQPNIDATDRKVMECTVIMRPDHALQAAVLILNQLRNLPLDVRLMYRIPDIEEA